MAPHSSILAGEISRTGEPGGLQSTGSQESDVTEHSTAQHSTVEETKTVLCQPDFRLFSNYN